MDYSTTTTVEASRPLPNGATTVVLRHPTVLELIRNEPFLIGEGRDGGTFLIEQPDNIEALLKICIVDPAPLIVLSSPDAILARRLKQALMGFFQSAGADGKASAEGSKTSPTSSSSPAGETSPQTLSIG